ncbi:MAG: radical SAM protein [Bdellovibrionaceae bacterium]|nr:radical SAM protein [Pseudobdellovibrionaceae bacterium]
MEWRRHKDIFAMKEGSRPAVALHARNLQVAELSAEAWDSMSPVTLLDSAPVSLPSPTEGREELEEWNGSDDPRSTADRNDFSVRSLTLNVTQICNLHCTYCAAGGDGTYGDPVRDISIENTLPQLRFFIEKIPAGGHFHIAFLGGEPLLYPDTLLALGRYARETGEARGVSVSFKVTTNGTLINDKALRALTDLGCHVTVSLDGPAEINDRQRLQKNGRGSFEAAFQGLQRLMARKSKLASLGVHAVFNEKNLEVEKAWEFLSPLPVDYMEFTYSVNGANHEATSTYNQQLARVLRLAWKRGGEQELRRISNVREIFDRLDQQRRRLNHCGLGKSMMVVDARNQLWSCPWTVGRANDRLGTGTVLDEDRLAVHQRSQIEVNECGSCWARFLCGGGCSFIHGSTDGFLRDKKSDFCERTRFLIGASLAYYHRARAL